MRKIIAIIFSLLFLNGVAHAGWGVSFMAGQLNTSGTENEKSGDVGPEKNSKSIKETFYGASLFVEGVADNGMTFGIDYIPIALELGSGQRTDTTTDANESSQDDGTYKASADVEHLITLYTNIPVGSNDGYALLGLHYAEITTSETLPNSTYGDEDVFGAQVGYGVKKGNLKWKQRRSYAFLARPLKPLWVDKKDS